MIKPCSAQSPKVGQNCSRWKSGVICATFEIFFLMIEVRTLCTLDENELQCQAILWLARNS